MNRSHFHRRAAATLLLLAAGGANAHPGHDAAEDALTYLVLIGVALGLAWLSLRRGRR